MLLLLNVIEMGTKWILIERGITAVNSNLNNDVVDGADDTPEDLALR